MRTLWLCEVTGGPFKYTGRPTGEAHEHLHITSEEFDEVGAEIANSTIPSVCRSAISGRSWSPSSRGKPR